SLNYPIPSFANKFFFSGGAPYLLNGFVYSFPGVTEPSNSNASLTGSNYGLSVTFWTDAPKFAIAQENQNTIPWRVIINGQYATLAGTVGSAGANPSYDIFDFSGVRMPRKVTIESMQAWQFAGVATGPTDTVWAPSSGDNVRMIVVGDSLSAG